MSRLKGRVTFPEGDGSSQLSSNDNSREVSQGAQETFKPAGDKPRRRGRGFNQVRQEEEERSERQERFQPQPPQQRYDRPAVRHDRTERVEKGNRFERSQQHQPPKTTERYNRSERREEHFEKPRKPTARIENVVTSEELLELEDIIAQISDLTIRSDRSAAQIKRNILGSTDLIDTMDEDDWQKVCESMVGTALEQGEPEFISDIIVALFKTDLFTGVMSDELMAVSSTHIMEQDEKPVPTFLAAILCAHWPRQYAKAFDNVNPVLYTVVCIIKGWILVVSEDTGRYYKEEKKPTIPVRNEEEEEETRKEESAVGEEEERIIEDPEVVNKCALALSDLCDTAQRQLWVNWMGVTDEIYQCIKPTITHNPNITGTVKARLLDTFVQMNQWTKTRTTSVKHAQVQTVSTATSSE